MRLHRAIQGMLLALLLLVAGEGFAQTTKISGTVYDAKSKEPLPFVNIAFMDSKIGTMTDLDGKFTLETYYATDTLLASYVGYMPRKFKVQKDVEQVIDMALETSSVQLSEVIIKPTEEENPAHIILRRVIANKKVNDREKLEAYEYETYNKVEFDLNNLSEKFTERKLFKPFEFIFDNIDSTDDKPYLPIFMTESLSEYFYRQKPKAHKEYIKGTKVSGVENESISQFLGDMYQNVNVYDNFLTVFGKNFVSPIANFGLGYYHYYLTDSAYIDQRWCYKLEFLPRRQQELTFVGEMWVNDTTYAIKRVEGSIAKDANINYVDKLWVRQEYDQVEHEVWMLTKDQLVVDFNIQDKALGIYGRKTATYKDFKINEPKEDAFYSGPDNIVLAEDVNAHSEEYWDENRHVELTEKEAAIYHMVDTMKSIPQFRTYVDIITLVVSGYYVRGPVEIGPYFKMLSFNDVEGARFRLGGRTSNDFSTRLMLEGYAAYGTKDTEVKFSLGGQYFLSKNPRQFIGAYYTHDLEQLGLSQTAFSQDNFLVSLFRTTPANKLTMIDETKVYYEREWFYGLSNRLMVRRRVMQPKGSLHYFQRDADNILVDVEEIITSEISLNTRFAYREKFVSGEFERVSLGTKYPILELHAAFGIPELFRSEYEYQKLVLRIDHKVQMGTFGYLRYWVEGGKIWGALPYPLLQIHSGNETFFYDESAFNTMRYFEFVSDAWASLAFTYHMNGYLLNRIPLFRKLKWREVIGARALVGNFNPKNLEEMELLDGMYTLDKPFAEANVGIENILKVFRVDAVWRLSYLDHKDVKNWGIRVQLHIDF